jgi:hypothetical protein
MNENQLNTKLTGYADDLDAINRYILQYNDTSKPPITNEAKPIKADWITWYGNLSWSDRNMSKENWILGRQKKDAFIKAMGFQISPGALTSEDIWPNGVPGSGLASGYQSAAQAVNITTNGLMFLALGIGIGALSILYLKKTTHMLYR